MNRPMIGAWALCACQLVFAQGQIALPSISINAQQQAALGVRTTAVQPASQQAWLASAIVTVPPGQEVSVSAAYPGVITKLHVGIGDTVHAGTPLAGLGSAQLADARRQLREAELDARNAQAALQRDQAMFDEGIISAARLQTTRHRQQASEAAWQSQQSALRASGLGTGSDYASGQMVSPRAGTVIDVQASVGQRVEAGALLFRIADTRQLQLDITLSAEKAARLRVGDEVSVPSHEARATLLGISHHLDASQQARARARVTQVGRLHSGQAVSVRMQPVMGKGVAAAWQVPSRAVLQMNGQSWLLVATSQGFTPTRVQVLSNDDDNAVVEGNLQAQQRVASAGLAALRPLLQKSE